jgi:hypothetical protein
MSTSPFLRISMTSVAALCAVASTLIAEPARAQSSYSFETSEAAFDASYIATSIALIGTVVDEAGAPLAGATVTTVGWGASAQNAGATAVAGTAGDFSLPSLKRRSVLLRVERAGYYTELVPADLHRSLSECATDVGAVMLTRKQANRARILVAGDTMFGRRFVDSDEDGIEGEPGDLIRPATRAEDAKALFTFMRDLLSSADYAQVNLECPVTAHPLTPHPYKSFTFFSYPETIGALSYAGIDAVTLGNNHVFDYLEAGVADTLSAVPAAGLDWFGAGMDGASAEGTVLYRTLGGGVNVAFQGFNQIVNSGTTLPEYTLTANDTPKAGALEMNTTNLADFTAAEAADRFAIPVLHGGLEYTDYPTTGMRQRFVQLVQQGAGVIVAHHPHTVHGVGLIDAGSGPRFVLMSLGNLLFDQDVFETFQSYLAELDVEQTGSGAYSVRRVQLVPYHIEDYVPKLVAGSWLGRAARHIGHLSTTLPSTPAPGSPPDGLTGAVVFPSGPRVVALGDASRYQISQLVETVVQPVTGLSTGPIAVPRTSAADTLAGLQTSAPMSCDLGREISIYGDFEDADVDDSSDEGSMWSVSQPHPIENSVVHSGASAMVLLRKSTSTTFTSTNMGNRVTFVPGNNLTLQGYVKGNNAGQLKIQVYWYTTDGGNVSNSYVYTRNAGTYNWEPFVVNLTVPAGATTVRAYYRSYAPASGEAATFLDDISLIEWEQSVTSTLAGATLPTPNNWSFLRCSTTNAGLASVNLTLTHKTYTLAPATP